MLIHGITSSISGGYSAIASNFTATDGLQGTPLVNGTSGTMSFWWNFDNSSSGLTVYFMRASGNRFQVIRSSANDLRMTGRNTSGVTIVDIRTAGSTDFTETGVWHHAHFSWDTTTGAGDVYIDGVDRTVTSVISAGTIDYNVGVGVWHITNSDAGAGDVLGCQSDWWCSSVYHDPATDIGSFISGGKPVDLGVDGSGPGAQPEIYFPDMATGVNAGSNGNYTVNGAPTSCASSPSD